MINSRARFFILKLLMIIMMILLLYKLFDLQVIKGAQYQQLSNSKISVNMIEKAPRGEITDRYGTPLITNRAGYSVELLKVDTTDEEFNRMLSEILKIFKQDNINCYDTLPITMTYPFSFNFEDDQNNTKKDEWFENNKYKKYIKEGMTAQQVIDAYINNIYHIDSSFSYDEARQIIGLRYEADLRGFSITSPCILAEDVSVDVVAKIKERQDEFPCIKIANNYIREYTNNGIASHILGRIGKMNKEEYSKYKDLGYGYNDMVGKQGIEKTCEEYLRGIDGTKGSEQTVNGNKITVVKETPAIAGNTVALTIDAELQTVAEKSLEKYITQIRESGGEKTGIDADSGAAVVIDIKTGDVLALASYPTYDLSKFNEEYESLIKSESKPLLNRAISGTYTPGSTFKPLTAIAALETGKITTNEKITDEGVYRFYAGYQPKCWIWSEYKTTHGSINISKAIEQSCNYFFYETGRRTGIDIIGDYAKKFGLGEYTGIELAEEVKGNIASPENKEKITGEKWFGGDTLQAAIGQSYNLFTPIQLANYVATIANGGTRYKVNIVKSVRSSVDGSLIKENTPEVVEKIDIKPENLDAVKIGMKDVVDEGSASAIFSGYPVNIGGKTGTAQLGANLSNNALFTAFAPFDNPEIAVCVVLEHGVRGANAAYVARDIFDNYFNISR